MRRNGENALVDIEAELRGETERAYRIFDGEKSVWVPKSLVERNSDGSFTMPFFLAKEKELI